MDHLGHERNFGYNLAKNMYALNVKFIQFNYISHWIFCPLGKRSPTGLPLLG